MSTVNITTSADPSQAFFDTLVRPSYSIILFEFIFYGAYTVLFTVYVYLQVQQRGRRRLCQISLAVLYLLATASMILDALAVQEVLVYLIGTLLQLGASQETSSISGQASSHFDLEISLRVAGMALYVTANFVADALLLYRCYIIWGSKKLVVVGLALVSFVNTGFACVATYFDKYDAGDMVQSEGQDSARNDPEKNIELAFLVNNLVTHLLLTGLIAGRLWSNFLFPNKTLEVSYRSQGRFEAIVSMLLESCLLYPIALVISIILKTQQSAIDIMPILIQIVGIAPTLIMVRADLGINVQIAADYQSGSKETISDIEVAHSEDFNPDRELGSITPWRGQATPGTTDRHPKYAHMYAAQNQALNSSTGTSEEFQHLPLTNSRFIHSKSLYSTKNDKSSLVVLCPPV
ncbi:hypothetical protein J3R30DRAFT_3703910 [Lentinula aciculospora]|uniref:Uncharacterized protein n=1 Tax=Lentinula aciculospora TaxID=153920 RepID=A0A9W9DN26_9AGAR|nr:hypothetical protein J3R30DRAFT_3703910 [Lentinula aciculospora]